MGERARQAFEVEFDKPIAIGRWEEVLRQVPSARISVIAGARNPGPHLLRLGGQDDKRWHSKHRDDECGQSLP
jgi:hypothetical protein